MSADLSRLSLNQKTTNSWSLPEAIDGCVRAGLESMGVWREPLAEVGVDKARHLLDEAGLRVSSLCRGGFLTAMDPQARRAALADNVAAIKEAAALGTDALVMVVGGLPPGSRDLPGARALVAKAIGELAPIAGDHGVRLALEPMHPIFTADRGVLATLGESLDLAEQFPADQVAVVVDTYHVWWDPGLEAQIARAGAQGRLASYQVCDWILPLAADLLLSRGYMGDGYVDFASIGRWVKAAGYTGDIEVEIFNQQVWDTPGDEVLAIMTDRYLRHVLPGLTAA